MHPSFISRHKKMNNSTILMIVSLALVICLSVAQAPIISGSSNNNSSHTIFTSGTVVNPTRIRKHVIAYGFSGGFSNERADFIADHFDVLDADYNEASISGFRRMKSRNPDLMIIAYKDVIAGGENLDETWYVHDKYGDKVQHAYYGWYLLDVGNDGWRDYYADWCKMVLEEQTIDGIFADDVWDSLPCGDYPDEWYNPWTVPNSWIDEVIGERWHSDMIDFISYVKQRIGNKPLVINTMDIGDYVDACDGKLDEEFVHPGWYSYTEFHSEYVVWTERVDWAKHVSGRGKYNLVCSGFSELLSGSPSQEVIDKMLMYCFSSYLLALEGDKTSFSFGTYWNVDDAKGYYSVFDDAKALGSPISDHYSYQYVYARDFENGKVLVNPSESSHTVSLGQNYETLDGQIVSNITLDDHTGVILLRI